MKTTQQPRSFIAILTGVMVIAPAVPRALAGREIKSPEPARTDIVPEMIGDLPGSGFKIGENESPLPRTRVFTTYNYFNNAAVNPGFGTPAVPSGTTTFGGTTLGGTRDNLDIHRVVIGFEKTFLDGNASFGIRLPIITDYTSGGTRTVVTGSTTQNVQTGTTTTNSGTSTVTTPVFTQVTTPVTGTVRNDSHSQTDLGDISLIGKYVLYRNDSTAISTGLVLTLPTSTADRGASDVKFQPFLGAIYTSGPFFVQGFTSILVPTDSRDTTWSYNDIGFGCHLLSTPVCCLNQLTPIFEVHVNTPINQTDREHVSVDLTGGLNLQFARGISLTFGASAPVTGPRPYDIEAVAQFNWRF